MVCILVSGASTSSSVAFFKEFVNSWDQMFDKIHLGPLVIIIIIITGQMSLTNYDIWPIKTSKSHNVFYFQLTNTNKLFIILLLIHLSLVTASSELQVL